MKEVREQQLCDQRKQIEEKHWLVELQIKTSEGEELQERNLTEEQQAIIFIIKEVLKSRTRKTLPY